LAVSGTRMSVEKMLICDADMKTKMIYNMHRYHDVRLLFKKLLAYVIHDLECTF
jgi:hypothetical protein